MLQLGFSLFVRNDFRTIRIDELKLLYAMVKIRKVSPVKFMMKQWKEVFDLKGDVGCTSLVTRIAQIWVYWIMLQFLTLMTSIASTLIMNILSKLICWKRTIMGNLPRCIWDIQLRFHDQTKTSVCMRWILLSLIYRLRKKRLIEVLLRE